MADCIFCRIVAGEIPAEIVARNEHAIAFRDLLLGGFVGMLVFVLILLLGLAYAWRKGAMTWR